MKHFLKILLVTTLLASAASSCRRTATPEAHKWPKVNSYFDSLTVMAENYLFNPLGVDSIANIVEKMDSVVAGLTGKKALEARAQAVYWNAITQIFTRRIEEAEQTLEKGRALTDSIGNDYLQLRFADVNETLLTKDTKGEETLRSLLDFLDYYGRVGDLAQQGNMAMFISNNLMYPPVPALSLRYLEMADSLFALAGIEGRREGLRLNRFNLMCHLDRLDEAQVEFDRLFAKAVADEDTLTMELLLRNHSCFYGDSASIYEGYNLVRSLAHPDSAVIGVSAMLGLYEALIGLYMLDSNELQKWGGYAQLCEKHLGEIADPDALIMEYKALAYYYSLIGDRKKGPDYLLKYTELQREITQNQQPANKVYLERQNTIHRHEMEVEAERQKMKKRELATVMVCVIVVLGLLIGISRWRIRQKMKSLQMKLDAERNERMILAMRMNNEKTEQLLDYVKNETERMSSGGNVDTKDLARIKANIKLHMAGRNEAETFEEAFANVSPEFVDRLKKLVPGLTAANIRLCIYTYMGLTTQEIASLMHITDNGLRVARFRLRQKFGLSKDDSFEDFLRNIADPR